MPFSSQSKAGFLFMVGGIQFGILMMLSETLYPGYSMMSNYISDLGTNCSGSTCYVPAFWWMFDGSEIAFGILIALGAYFFYKAYGRKPESVIIALSGFSLVGVGTFNESFSPWHSLFSLLIFLFASVAAILSYRFQKAPLSYISVAMGVLSLVSLLSYIPAGGSFGNTLGIGPGGLERLIVYPVLLWVTGFGGHLMAS